MKLLASLPAAATMLLASTGWAQGYTQPGQPPLQSGGLTPPSSGQQPDPQTTAAPPPSETEKDLQEADSEDSGRGLEFFWINAEAGLTTVKLDTFKSEDLVPANVKTNATGPVFGVGLGLRLIFITIGPRFRLANLSLGQLWTLNGELGIRIPLGSIEPYFTLGGGYASVGSFDTDNIGTQLNKDDVEITGYNVRVSGGLDWYITSVFSIGASASFEVLGLTRPDVLDQLQGGMTPTPMSEEEAEQAVLSVDGSSVGTAATFTAVLGLHF